MKLPRLRYYINEWLAMGICPIAPVLVRLKDGTEIEIKGNPVLRGGKEPAFILVQK